MREDVDRVRALRAATLDAARPEAVAKRRKTGHWTAREQVDALLDPGSFAEYGALPRPIRDDMEGAADGLITGTGQVAGQSCAILAYDYTVYAGTQSLINHKKHDRIFEITEKLRLPMVCWLEGGGARPHDLNAGSGLGLDLATFMAFARLSGQARENVKHGLEPWAQYFRDIATFPIVPPEIDDAYEYLTENSMAVIGDPDDAIRHIEKLLKGSGGFGTYLELTHNWADFDATLEHYELMARYVIPYFNNKNDLRQVSYDYSHENREVFVGQAQRAVETEIERQAEREAERASGDD